MSEEEILKVAQKVLELQEQNGKRFVAYSNNSQSIADKYRKDLWKLFGTTGSIEQAVRTVACYMCGARTLNQLSLEKHYAAREIMDELYKRIIENNMHKNND